MNRHNRQRGFTYIELMVVAMIIAILAAILFPVFAQARAKAHQLECECNLRNLHAAMVLHAREHHGRYPPGDSLDALRPYLQDDSVLSCPLDPEPLALDSDGLIQRCSYEYAGGFGLDSDPKIALARCRDPNHSPGTHWLFADGRVKWIRAPGESEVTRTDQPELGRPYGER